MKRLQTKEELLSVLQEAFDAYSASPSFRKDKKPFLFAIDGRCGAGKSTLALWLRESLAKQALPCLLFRMDDFFLPPEMRTAKRLSVPGENVYHERFLHEVLLPLSERRAFSFAPFRCADGKDGEKITVSPAPLAIIEGSYACHASLSPFYHLRCFLTVSPEEQEKRLLRREGKEKFALFQKKWIPLEESYFALPETMARFELILSADRGFSL